MYVKTLNMFALGFFDSFIEHQQSKATCPFQQIRHKNEANRGFLALAYLAWFPALVSLPWFPALGFCALRVPQGEAFI